MNTLNIHEKEFTNEPPTEAGKYLTFNKLSGIDLVNVFWYPPKSEYGFHWEGYYGVREWAGKNVKGVRTQWLKVTWEDWIGEIHE